MAEKSPENGAPQKLKILYLITKSNWGGAQRYVYDLATHAAKEGHDVAVGFGGNGLLAERLAKAKVRTHAIDSLGRDMKFGSDLKAFFSLLAMIIRESPDVVHLNSSKMGGIGALAARLANVPRQMKRLVRKDVRPIRIVFTGHGWSFTEEWRPDWQRALIAIAHWGTIALSHVTIAVSETTREEISRIPFTKRKLVVVHNGTDDIAVLSREAAMKKLFGTKESERPPEGTLVVGTIGELHLNKGHAYALEAMNILKRQGKSNARLVIVGSGEERESLLALRQRLELDEEVVFHESMNARELLSGFDVFLFPSIKEGFPYAILEAGSVGLPVIATAVGGIPEVIDDMKSGILIQSKNPGEIARALAYLIDDPEKRELFGEAIKQRIHGRFDLPAMTEKTLRLYRDAR